MEGGTCPRLLNGVRVDPELQAPVKSSFYHCQGPETLNVHVTKANCHQIVRELPLLSDYLGAACFGGLGQDAISATRWPGSSTKSLFPTEPLISYLQHGDNTTYLMEILRTSNINFPSSFLCKTCSLPFFPKRDANPGKVERQLG